MTKATVRIPKDVKHRIVIPNEIWEVENLKEGDLMEIDIKKIEGWVCEKRIKITEKSNFVKINPSDKIDDASIIILPAYNYRLSIPEGKGYIMKLTLKQADVDVPDETIVTLYKEDTFLQNKGPLLYKYNYGALKTYGARLSKQINLDDRYALMVYVEDKNYRKIHPDYIKLEIELDYWYKR